VLGLDEQGTPSGMALVAAGTLTVVDERSQFWTGGFDLEETRWDVPLLPGLGSTGYNPALPCSFHAGVGEYEHCHDARNHPEYHAAFLRYEVAIDPALSATHIFEDGWYLQQTCTGAQQTWTAALDLEFPVKTTDEGYQRMLAARAAGCPIRVEVVSHTGHAPDVANVKTRALGAFTLLDTAQSPAAVLFQQPFDEAYEGPGRKGGDRVKKWEVPAEQGLSALTVRWTGMLTLTCKAGAATTERPVGVSLVGRKPMFQWDCLPEDPPPTD
jgi:hypothetical protein